MSSKPLLADLHTASGSESLLHVTFIMVSKSRSKARSYSAARGGLGELTVDGELEGGQSTDHEETSTDTSVGATETKLFSDLDQTAGGALTGQTLGLVDPGQHGVGRLGDESGGETGNQTRAKVDGGLHGLGQGRLGLDGEDGLGDLLENDELGASVRNPSVAKVSIDDQHKPANPKA